MICYTEAGNVMLTKIEPKPRYQSLYNLLMKNFVPFLGNEDERSRSGFFMQNGEIHYEADEIESFKFTNLLEQDMKNLLRINSGSQEGSFVVNGFDFGRFTGGINFNNGFISILTEIKTKDNKVDSSYELKRYKLVYPALVKLFIEGSVINTKDEQLNQVLLDMFNNSYFDMLSLVKDSNDLMRVNTFIKACEGERLKNILTEEFPQFAYFCYDIYPYIKFRILKSIAIKELFYLKDQLSNLMNSNESEKISKMVDVSATNEYILSLMMRANA